MLGLTPDAVGTAALQCIAVPQGNLAVGLLQTAPLVRAVAPVGWSSRLQLPLVAFLLTLLQVTL